MAKELHFFLGKRALLQLEKEFVISEFLEDLSQISGMLLKRGAIHHYVIQVHDHGAVEEWLEHLVYECVKCGRCISKVKRHHKEFERPVPCSARCLRFVSLGDAYLVVPEAQVEFGEVPRFTKLVKQVRNQGNQIFILDGDLVERSIVDAHP